MTTVSWRMRIALALVLSSIALGMLHATIFGDPGTLLFYLALDVVFVPVQVLIVTFIIESFLSQREKQSLMKKMNMCIGAFFSEVGYSLMAKMGSTCVDFSTLEQRLAVDGRWDKKEYSTAADFIAEYECRFDSPAEHLEDLQRFLQAKRRFILGLLQNPNLLEHDRFTDLLWAVCHLTEELDARTDLSALPASDLDHLEGDIQRAFGRLVREWLSYMQHLKESYPYIYSLALRTNPFKPQASPIVLDDPKGAKIRGQSGRSPATSRAS